jgi:hypothetical protein
LSGCLTEGTKDEIIVDYSPIASNIINHSKYLKKFGWDTEKSSGVIGKINQYDNRKIIGGHLESRPNDVSTAREILPIKNPIKVKR